MSRVEIPLSSPYIEDDDRNVVAEVLNGRTLSIGPWVERFEQLLAGESDRQYAVAVSSGTAALHLIVRALGWKAGDEVITTPFSFVASANCLIYEGVRPVFVDIDPVTRCIDPARVEAAITPRTVGIISVDVFGFPADWDALTAIAARRGLVLVTDSVRVARHVAPLERTPRAGRQGGNRRRVRVLSEQADHDRRRRRRRHRRRAVGAAVPLDAQSGTRRRRRLAATCAARLQLSPFGVEQRIGGHAGHPARRDSPAASPGRDEVRRSASLAGRRRGSADRSGGRPVLVRLRRQDCRRALERATATACSPGFALAASGARTTSPPIHLQPYIRELLGCGPGDFPATEQIADRTIALPFFTALGADAQETVIDELARQIAAVAAATR